MPSAKIPVAIAYDFDGTLAPGNMQERDFIPALKLKPTQFWQKVNAHAKDHDMDEILAYMDLMLLEAKAKQVKINHQAFFDYGKSLTFFPGVEGWFNRINAYGGKLGLDIKHYIISSGLREMIAGTKIAPHFKFVFASGFRYDQHEVAEWPALAVNYTNKAQFLFRINKGIPNSWDNSTINKFMPHEKRPVPFANMLYLGDGETDIPAMKMLTYQGGRAIAVYHPRRKGAKKSAVRLVEEEDRADAAVRADYSMDTPLDKAVKATLDEIAARRRFRAAHKFAMR